MNISPHLLIDAVILSTALIITLVLRAKGNAAKKENKWLKKDQQDLNISSKRNVLKEIIVLLSYSF